MVHVGSTVEDCNLDFLYAGSPTRRHDRMDIAEEITEPSIGCRRLSVVSLPCKIGIIRTDASACASEVTIGKSSKSKPQSAVPLSPLGPAFCAEQFCCNVSHRRSRRAQDRWGCGPCRQYSLFCCPNTFRIVGT